MFSHSLTQQVDQVDIYENSSKLIEPTGGRLIDRVALVDPVSEFGSPHSERWARSYKGHLGACRAPTGSVDRALGQRVRAKPLKLNAVLHYYNLRSRPICSEICFFVKQKFSSDVMAAWPHWIRHCRVYLWKQRLDRRCSTWSTTWHICNGNKRLSTPRMIMWNDAHVGYWVRPRLIIVILACSCVLRSRCLASWIWAKMRQ